MKIKQFAPTLIAFLSLGAFLAYADTPPPGTVKLKGGTDNSVIGNVGDSIKVNVTNSGGMSTVNQGQPGPLASPWPVIITTPVPVTGSLVASNPSVGPVPSPVPTQATLVGGQDPSGNLQNFRLNASNALQVDGSGFTQPVSGSLGRSWTLGVGDSVNVLNFPASFGRTWNLSFANDKADVSGSSVSVSNFPGSQTINGSVSVSNFPATQPISAVSLPLPTGASTSANQTTAISSLSSIDGKLTTTVNGLKVDGSGVTQPVSASALPLPSGASTSALQTTGNTSLNSIDSKLGTLGQKTMSGSAPVAIASDQSTLPVSAASLPLPAGAATSALQTTGNSSLSSIDSKFGTLGQKASAGSAPVVIASDQSTLPVSAAALPLPAGAATSANQTSQITQETTTATNTTSMLANQTNGTQKTQVTAIPVDTAPATQNITIVDSGSASTAVANGQNLITGTPTVGSVASFALTTAESVEILVTGTWTGTMATEISMDGGTTWTTRGIKQSGSAYIASSFTQNFQGGMNTGGMTNVRVRSTAIQTGTATVKITASVNTSSITVSNPQMLRDSTTQSILNTIKAASTAAVATDPALVVAISPNNTPVLPSGAATSANQTNGSEKTQLVDGSAVVAGPYSTISGVNYLPVIQASSGTNGSAVPARNTLIGGSDGTNDRTLLMDASGVAQVSLGSSGGKSVIGKNGNLTTTTLTSNQTILTYTVTSGKTFYLEEADCGVVLNASAATQTQFGTCDLLINGVHVWSQFYKGPGSGSFQPTLNWSEPIPVTSGQVIQWVTTPFAVTSFLWNANFMGYEK